MTKTFLTLFQAGVLLLPAVGLAATTGKTFTMNGRTVELLNSAETGAKTRGAAAEDERVTVRDLESGQVSVYASGLVITLKDAAAVKTVLKDHPALTLQYATGPYAFVRVANAALAAAFEALQADPRVAAVHLRALPVPVKPR